MKPVSTLAIGVAMTALLAGIGSPADAQRRNRNQQAEQPAAQPGQWTPTLSREFRAPAAAADTAIAAQDWATAQAQIAVAQPLATTPDEKYTLGSLKLKVAQGQQNQAAQRAALQEMVDSGIDPYNKNAEYRFYIGNLAYQANDFPTAIQQLTAAEQGGYSNPNMNLVLAEAYWKSNQAAQGFQRVERAIELEKQAGRTPPADWYRRAASVAYQARNMPEVAKWTRLQVEAYPTAENWRSVLVIWNEAQPDSLDNQVRLDLYRLMRATGALTSERDYYEYAQLAYDRGLFGEAKMVIDEGQTAGRIQRTAPAFAQIYPQATQRNTAEERSINTEFGRLAASSAADALDTANVLLARGDWTRAAEAYRAAIQKGGIDTNLANMRLGIALARSGQADAARQTFSQVTGPRQELANLWTLYAGQPRTAA